MTREDAERKIRLFTQETHDLNISYRALQSAADALQAKADQSKTMRDHKDQIIAEVYKEWFSLTAGATSSQKSQEEAE